jgi:hypothetical protein
MVTTTLNTRRGRKKGTPKTGGRKLGTPNKATIEIREIARGLVDGAEYRHNLERRLKSGRLAPAMEQTLWAYAYGKPKDISDVTVHVSRMIRIIPPREERAT